MVSIVMPVYNGARYLRESLDSILNQTYEEWELILVDDCSTDASPGIMEEYAGEEARIRIIRNERNLKLPRALNRGFREAKGEYYTWTSDDNKYRPGALEALVDYLDRHKEVGIAYSAMDFVDEGGNKISTSYCAPDMIGVLNCVRACFLYRAEIMERVGEYDPDMFLVEDYDYWIRVSKKYKLAAINESLYEYRVHDGSLTGKRMADITRQNHRLRLRELDYLLTYVTGEDRRKLFEEMVKLDYRKAGYLREKFWPNDSTPDDLRWMGHIKPLDERKIILFGAGKIGDEALGYLGRDRVFYYADNDQDKVGRIKNGIEIISFEQMLEVHKGYQIVISIGYRRLPELANQLLDHGIEDYLCFYFLTTDILAE